MNPFLSAYTLLRLAAPVNEIPKGDLLLMAHGMREAFKPVFDDLMSASDRGVGHVLGEVAPFHVPGRDIIPLTVAFNGMSKPPNFRCMLLACLKADQRFPFDNIATGVLGSVSESSGHDEWLLVSLDGQWFVLGRTFSLNTERGAGSKTEITQTYYLLDRLSDDCLAGLLEKSPGAVRQMAKALSFRSGLHADSLRNRLLFLEEGERFGQTFHDLFEKV